MKVFELPAFPFTETGGCADLGFLYDEETCHGRLEKFYPQHYGQGMGSPHYLQKFSEFIRPFMRWHSIVDLGGNDGALGKWFDVQWTVVDGDGAIEKAVFPKGTSFVSSHTIEHLADPGIMVAKVAESLLPGRVFALQFPSLDLLVQDHRFEQVFHGHYHYFSERSITALLAKHGLRVIAKEWNPDHWGTLMLVCEKGNGEVTGQRITATDIRYSRCVFRMQMTSCREALRDFVCYGASPMLPVWGYYLPIEKAGFVADDYKNPKSLRDRDVLITAVSKATARVLIAKAFEAGARNVIVPFTKL